MLYFHAQSYRNNWTYANNEQLKTLLFGNNLRDEQYKLPILKSFNGDLLESSIEFNFVVESKNKNEKKINILNKNKNNLLNILESLKQEYNSYQSQINHIENAGTEQMILNNYKI
jgi:hypothetical protein